MFTFNMWKKYLKHWSIFHCIAFNIQVWQSIQFCFHLFFFTYFLLLCCPSALNWSDCASKVCEIKLDWLFKHQHQLFGCCKKFFSYLNIHLITKLIIRYVNHSHVNRNRLYWLEHKEKMEDGKWKSASRKVKVKYKT